MPWTKVDADFQIQNLPPPGGGFIYKGINPDTGPFTTSPLQFDQQTGFALFDGLAQLQLASLSQWGVIGTDGEQSLQGPFYLYAPTVSLSPPSFPGPQLALALLGGSLSIWDVLDDTSMAPGLDLSWFDDGGGSGDATLQTTGRLTLESGVASAINIISAGGFPVGADLVLDGIGGSFLGSGTSITFEAGSALMTLFTDGSGFGVLDINRFGPAGNPYFSVLGFAGQYGTDSIGNEFTGGICTFVGGGGGGVPWASITGTPTTLLGYGILDAVPFPPAPTIGYVLTWNGFTVDWEPGGGGTPTSISNGGGTVAVDGAGNVASTPNAGSTNVLFGPNANTFLSFNSSGAFNAWANNHPFIQCDSGGNHQFLSGTSSLSIANNGTIALNGPNAAYIGTNNTGDVFIAPAPTHGFSIFGAPPVPQQVPSGVLLGFTPNASANPVYNESTWDGGFGGSAYGITDIVRALKLYGWFSF